MLTKELRRELENILSEYTTIKISLLYNRRTEIYSVYSYNVSYAFIQEYITKDIEALLKHCGITSKVFPWVLDFTSEELEKFYALIKLKGLPQE